MPQALSDLEAVLQEQPEHALAMARLAFGRMAIGAVDEARALYRASLSLAPHRVGVWVSLARLYMHDQQWIDVQWAVEQAGQAIAAQAQGATELEGPLAEFENQIKVLRLQLWAATQEAARAEAWLDEARQAAMAAWPTEVAETPAAEGDAPWVAHWLPYVQAYAQALAASDAHAAAEATLVDAWRHAPKSLDLLRQRAELAQTQGRTGQALGLLRQAIRLAKQQDKPAAVEVGLQVQLAEACSMGMDGPKRHAAERAHDLAQVLVADDSFSASAVQALQWAAQCALASVESNAGNFARAQELFQAVLAQNEYHLKALQGLGHQALQQGRIDEAVAYFERVKAVDPVRGITSLINARQVPRDEETLTLLEALAAQPSMEGSEGSERSALLFSLASAWEKNKDFARAFALVDRANAASRKHLSYSPSAHRQQCARIRYAFGSELFAHRKDCGYRGEDARLPVFVVGMPRSGTTLVEQILAGHSAIFGAGELGVISAGVQGLNRWERHTGSGRAYPDCVDDMTPAFTDALARNIIEELKALAAESKPEARFVVDKLPHNFEHIGLIKFLFPEAKIISVRRDPRDIAISNYFTDFAAKHGGMGFAYDLEWIDQQLADHNLLMHHWNQVFPGEILEMQYEDVVEDIEGMARKMLDYIGVDWEPKVVAFNELDRPVKTASVWQVRQPIYKTSKAKWARYQDHLAPLIRGTNAKITWEPFEMSILPQPGWLTDGVAQYKADDLDGAEYTFKKLLHHLPEHAAAKAMVALIYLRKGHPNEGVALLEQAVERCPWNPAWREDLAKALEIVGNAEQAQAARQRRWPERKREDDAGAELSEADDFGALTTSAMEERW